MKIGLTEGSKYLSASKSKLAGNVFVVFLLSELRFSVAEVFFTFTEYHSEVSRLFPEVWLYFNGLKKRISSDSCCDQRISRKLCHTETIIQGFVVR